MKTYIVKVNDSTEAESREKALKLLSYHPNAFSAIYGYRRGNNEDVWLATPILCNTYEDAKAEQSRLNDRKGQTRVIVHSVHQQNLD